MPKNASRKRKKLTAVEHTVVQSDRISLAYIAEDLVNHMAANRSEPHSEWSEAERRAYDSALGYLEAQFDMGATADTLHATREEIE